MKRVIIASLAIPAIALAAYFTAPRFLTGSQAEQTTTSPDRALVSIRLPPSFSPKAEAGKKVFEVTCAKCHGANGTGVNGSGPPLIHKIYEPSHHGDPAFYRAVQSGVRSHHWQFGDMPPLTGITKADVSAVIAFIREIQRENGIE